MNTSEQRAGQRILTMASPGLRDPDGYHGRMREAAAGQERAAEGALAPPAKTMQETGLPGTGPAIALSGQVPAVHRDGPQATSAVRDRLSLARDMIRGRVNLLALPEATAGYGHAVMPLPGAPAAGSAANAGAGGWQLH